MIESRFAPPIAGNVLRANVFTYSGLWVLTKPCLTTFIERLAGGTETSLQIWTEAGGVVVRDSQETPFMEKTHTRLEVTYFPIAFTTDSVVALGER